MMMNNNSSARGRNRRQNELGVHLNISDDTRLVARAAELAILDVAFRNISSSSSSQEAEGEEENSSNSSKCSILVTGKKGSGKTKLVRTFRETVIYSGGSYAGGKFVEEGQRSSNNCRQRCSVFWQAVSDLFDPCNLTLDDEIKQEIRSRLSDEDEMQILFQMVPTLREMLQSESTTEAGDKTGELDASTMSQDGGETTEQQLSAIAGKLFCAVTRFNPVVLFLDDLQWSDEGSMEMVQSLLSNEDLRRFMFVGAHCTEDDDASSVAINNNGILLANTSSIHLTEFSEQNVARLLSNILRLDYSLTQPLAQQVHRKTAGNAHHVLQYLKMLEQKGLLQFSFTDYRWVWDLERIVAETESASNVVGSCVDAFQSLDSDTQAALAVAACFGNKFVGNVIRVVLQMLAAEQEGPEHDDENDDASNNHSNNSNCDNATRGDATVSNALLGEDQQHICTQKLRAHLGLDTFRSCTVTILETAVNKGLIDEMPQTESTNNNSSSKERTSSSNMSSVVYKFVHGKIQTAAYDLVTARDRECLHLQLAKILWTQMLPHATGEEDRDTLLVQIADQLDLAQTLVAKESEAFRVRVAQLNLQSAQSVRRNGAFLTAAQCLQRSAKLLGDSKWTSHYGLTLEILNLQAEMYFCCGKVLECKNCVTEILTSAVCTEDKLDAYVVLIDCLGSQKKHEEALVTTYSVLAHNGFSTPKQTAGAHHVFLQLFQTKKAVKGYSDEDLLGYRECNDRTVEGCLKLLSRTAPIAWMAGEGNDAAFISMLMCHISLTHGFTKFSSNSFVIFALILTKMGDVEKGKRYGKLALDLSDRFKAIECDGQTMLVYYSFIHHMTTPVHSLLDPLIQTNRRAKAGGDIEHSHHACTVYIFTYLLCGLPLSVIDTDAKEFISEMRQYKRSAALTHARIYRQLALNLIHRSRDPYKLEGSEVGNLTALLMKGNEVDNKRTREGVVNCQLYLACYLGRGQEGKRIVQEHAKLKDQEYPMCYATFFPYLRGMVFFRLARTCKKNRRYYRRRAAREIRQVKAFVRHGFVNCSHQLFILQAEMLAHRQKPDSLVKEAYDKAIALSIRSGFPQDAGLASQNAARFFRDRNEDWSDVCLERAVGQFQQWGAEAKIARLQDLSSGAMMLDGSGYLSASGDGTSTVSSAIHGRSRRNSFYRNSDHQTIDWFLNSNGSNTRRRRNLSVTIGPNSFQRP